MEARPFLPMDDQGDLLAQDQQALAEATEDFLVDL
jgi:hypothetical protein